jgi:hypothetical protein
MEPHEQRILVTQATAGMVLARAITLPDKMVLLGSGATLTEGTIGQLMGRGIKRIVVRGHPLSGLATTSWDERMAQLDARFSRVRTHPFMSALREVVARVMARKS